MKQKVIVWIIVFLCLVSIATATGIRPAKTTIAFDEGRDYSKEFWIVNNDARQFVVDIIVEGEMAEFITLEKDTIAFRDDKEADVVKFEVHLPEEVPPGTSTANIIVQEKRGDKEPGVISSVIVLKHKVIIEGPYPDKYVVATVNFQETTNSIKFVSEVENLGKKDISEVKTTFYVNDKEQKEQQLETESTSLPTKEKTLLTVEMERNAFDDGEYQVSAVTSYDDQTVELYKNLIVGKPEVDITYFNKYFVANKINPYSMELLNQWNQLIKNVFVDVDVIKDQQKIDEFRTKSVDIEGEMTARINDYLDAKDKGPGTYTFEMAVNFWNLVRMDQKKFTIQSELVSENDADNLGQALTGNAVASTDSSGTGAMVWVLMVIIGLLLAGIGVYVGYRYKHKDEYDS